MQTACVILGKTGDIFSGLPIVQRLDASLVTSRQYLPAVAGIPGLKLDVWPGDWQDLAGAYKWAKKKYSRVLVPQTFGKDFPIRHIGPSWQHDQYFRAGIANEFDTVPLKIPNTNGHIPPSRILVASHSESSPFPFRDDLLKTLRERFDDSHGILDVSAMQLPNVRDFLPFYGAAHCLVSIDTMHLHLSEASHVPTIALVADRPQHWHGSAWKRRYAMHCRYSEFPARKDEFIRTLEAILAKRPIPRIEPMSTWGFTNGYNPSVIDFDGKRLMTFRYHPERRNWRTLLVMDDGKLCVPIKVPDQFKAHSWEDGRLFTFKNKLHISYVLSVYPSNPARCVVGYSPLVHNGIEWEIAEHRQPEWGANSFKGMEKNWVFFESQGRLYAIVKSAPHTVVEISGTKIVNEFKSPMPKWNYGEIRGGALATVGNVIHRFFHSKTGRGHRHYEFRYHVGHLTMESQSPFRVLSIDEHPVISGNEMWVADCDHWKPNVVFPGGALVDDVGIKLALGWNDCRCGMLTIP